MAWTLTMLVRQVLGMEDIFARVGEVLEVTASNEGGNICSWSRGGLVWR